MSAPVSSKPEVGSVVMTANKDASPESNTSGATWSAALAGAAVSAALGLILLALGTGLGLSSVSLWSTASLSRSAIGTGAIVWLILMQFMSSSMGGYIAGRLRTKWTAIHSDEVYFRDTAHGFLAWSVSLVFTAAFLATAAAALVGTPDSRDMSDGKSQGTVSSYFVDELFRSSAPKPDIAVRPTTEAEVIFAHSLRTGDLTGQDQQYLGALVSAYTGLSQADADKRVIEVFGDAKQSADALRKATAHSLLWLFAALLIGAFSSSFAATIGGRQRDNVVVI